MTINRRTAVRQIFLFSAGAFLLPSCLHDRSKSAILLRHFKLEDGQEELLAALTDTLIPGTSPGSGGAGSAAAGDNSAGTIRRGDATHGGDTAAAARKGDIAAGHDTAAATRIDRAPGARDISAHLFVLKMLDDCHSSADQQRFVRGLRQLDEAALKANGVSFVKSDAAGRQSFLRALESRAVPGEDVAFCYDLLKGRTVQAYTSSQFYLSNVRVYEMIPGRYHGCVPVKTT